VAIIDFAKLRTPFIHPSAVVDDGACLGEGTRVWAFAHVLGSAIVRRDCNICDHTFIEGEVRIGHRVTILFGIWQSGPDVWMGVPLRRNACSDFGLQPGLLLRVGLPTDR
jgi:NDP-sugar pyrophosphorylase family protein